MTRGTRGCVLLTPGQNQAARLRNLGPPAIARTGRCCSECPHARRRRVDNGARKTRFRRSSRVCSSGGKGERRDTGGRITISLGRRCSPRSRECQSDGRRAKVSHAGARDSIFPPVPSEIGTSGRANFNMGDLTSYDSKHLIQLIGVSVCVLLGFLGPSETLNHPRSAFEKTMSTRTSYGVHRTPRRRASDTRRRIFPSRSVQYVLRIRLSVLNFTPYHERM